MQPPAEMVHWLFATGLLLLGLCLVCEGIVGAEVWRMRAWRIYLWPGLVVRDGRPDVARDDLLHQLGDPHVRARLVGRGADARRRRRAGARARQAQVALVASHDAVRLRRHRHRRSSSTSRTRWFFARSAFLHHLLGWTFLIAAVFPLGMVVLAPVARVPDGVRAHVRRRSPRCSTPTATWRRSSAICRPRRAPAPMRRLRSSSRSWRCSSRPRRRRTRRSARRRRASRPSCRPARARFASTSTRRCGSCRARSRFSNANGKNFAGAVRVEKTEIVAAVRPLPRGAVHGPLARDLVRLARRLGRLDVRRSRAGAGRRRRVRRGRADDGRARRPLAVVPRARAHDRLARLPPDLPARARGAAGARAPARRRRGPRRRRWRCRSGSPRSRCAPRTRCSSRSGGSSTATCRR